MKKKNKQTKTSYPDYEAAVAEEGRRGKLEVNKDSNRKTSLKLKTLYGSARHLGHGEGTIILYIK